MSMSMDRRQVVQTAAAAAVALPLAANAKCDNAGIKCTTDQINKNAAPIVSSILPLHALKMFGIADILTQITVFDHRGCSEHVNREYTGPKAGNDNDEMALKVCMLLRADAFLLSARAEGKMIVATLAWIQNLGTCPVVM
jgi:hypothetical protein